LQPALQNSKRHHQLLIEKLEAVSRGGSDPGAALAAPIERSRTMDNGNSDRNRDGRFRKGQSGNPGGRPKIFTEVKQAAREHTEAAIAALVGVVNNEEAPAAARVAAANAILDRGWGKPETYTNMAHHNKPLRELTDAELTAIITGEDSDDEPEVDPEQLN
jgi:hypothetical protein